MSDISSALSGSELIEQVAEGGPERMQAAGGAAVFLSKALSMAKTCSIGVWPGLYGGSNPGDLMHAEIVYYHDGLRAVFQLASAVRSSTMDAASRTRSFSRN